MVLQGYFADVNSFTMHCLESGSTKFMLISEFMNTLD